MPSLQLLDTFPAFERYWRAVRTQPLEVQIDRWEHGYMAAWPELLEKQQQNYSEEGLDWKQIARTRIFPHLPERLPRMRRLHANLLRTLPDSWSRTRRALKVDFPVRFVIYVGVGLGAGWATRYGGQPACLFGLENAAEIASGKDAANPGAVSHEVAHLTQDEWRRRRGLRGIEEPRGPYWQLYEEGFATECERRIEDPRSFRLKTGQADWLPWCRRHRAWLAAKFLRDVEARRSMRPFFGSWYDIRGHIECGYYLGQEMVREWTETASLQKVAVLPEPVVRRKARSTLRRWAEVDRTGMNGAHGRGPTARRVRHEC
ncbi:MAG: hypothetical protein WBW40_08320 [Thermoplasmata archaeon]